jgi:hypothetical protein
VRRAFNDVGYDGWMTTEIDGGDAAYLKDVVGRFDRFPGRPEAAGDSGHVIRRAIPGAGAVVFLAASLLGAPRSRRRDGDRGDGRTASGPPCR